MADLTENQVANCDVCDKRPGNRTVLVTGIETWVCDVCSGAESPQEDSEVLLLVKRVGIDKDWQVAPYPRTTRARTEKLAEWLKRAMPGLELDTRIIEV